MTLGVATGLDLQSQARLWRELPEKERVPTTFLAIDLDRSALEAGDANRQLDDLFEDEFLYLDPRSIQEALRHLDRTHGEQPAWANVNPSRRRCSTGSRSGSGCAGWARGRELPRPPLTAWCRF